MAGKPQEPFPRFVSKIKLMENGCWQWLGHLSIKGYGNFSVNGKSMRAHRFAWEYFNGLIQDGLVIDHKCRNPGCSNPEHLRLVTAAVNTLENSFGKSAINAKKTHCDNGHPFTKENTINNHGNRGCKKCNRAQKLASYHRLKKFKGVKDRVVKLTPDQHRQIFLATGKLKDIGDRFGICFQHVSQIKHRQRGKQYTEGL